MISLEEMRVEARDRGIAPEVLEKDYCLGWFIHGIARSPLSGDLVLKGGTALRKGYFADYRFSEDLDFTARRALDDEELRGGLEQACRIGALASGVAFEMVVLTAFEEVLLEPDLRPILHPYSDAFESRAAFCQLEEILAEKLRTILQRGYPRDVYDVWYIVGNARDQFDAKAVQALFHRKCAYKGVSYSGVSQFLDILETKNTAAHWSRTLGMQIRDLSGFEAVRRELEAGLRRFLS